MWALSSLIPFGKTGLNICVLSKKYHLLREHFRGKMHYQRADLCCWATNELSQGQWSSPSDAVEVWCYQRADCGASLSAPGKWALRLQPHMVENWMSQRISNWSVVEDVTVSVHNIDLYWAFVPASDNVHPNPARWIMGIKRVFLPAAAGAQTLVPYSQSSPCPFST